MGTLFCPNCGASLKNENNKDIFICPYCEHEIIVSGRGSKLVEEKMQKRQLKHEEKMQDKRNQQERYRMEQDKKEQKKGLIGGLGILVGVGLLCFVITTVGNSGAKKQEEQLQSIVDQIMVDIENENFSAAYIKANSLYWDESWTSEGTEKWDATREEVIKQIEKAEKNAN